MEFVYRGLGHRNFRKDIREHYNVLESFNLRGKSARDVYTIVFRMCRRFGYEISYDVRSDTFRVHSMPLSMADCFVFHAEPHREAVVTAAFRAAQNTALAKLNRIAQAEIMAEKRY